MFVNRKRKTVEGYNYKFSPVTSGEGRKIALCFMIYDKINHESLWHSFYEKHKDKCNTYIHFKESTPLKYFEKAKLKNCIHTKWGDISLVKAQNLLLDKAISDEAENEHFIFLSNSCIPLKGFDYIFNSLDPNYSYFNKAPDEQIFPRCNRTLKMLSRKYIKKANMMSILNRKHAQLILKNKNKMIKWFDYDRVVPDEHCYITLLHYLGLYKELIMTQNTSYSGATTFSPWENMIDYKVFPKSVKINSYTYKIICEEELKYLINSKCLFGRKFLPEAKVLKDNGSYITLENYLKNIIKSNPSSMRK